MPLERRFEQTLRDVTVTATLSGPTTAKQVRVVAGPFRLSVAVNGETVLDGELYAPVHEDESTWYIEDGRELSIVLEKQNGTEWWPHVLTTDPKIDVKKIKPEQSKLSDLDAETRATVEKMMFDQRTKASEDQRKSSMLEQFKRQHPELDFSKVDTSKRP